MKLDEAERQPHQVLKVKEMVRERRMDKLLRRGVFPA